jgi:hypothetical protein
MLLLLGSSGKSNSTTVLNCALQQPVKEKHGEVNSSVYHSLMVINDEIYSM